MDNLPPDLQAKIKEKQNEYKEFIKKQTESKLNDICTLSGVTMEEAVCALEICENDELAAIERINAEPTFRLKIQEMAKGTSEKIDGENVNDEDGKKSSPELEEEEDDDGAIDDDDDDASVASDDEDVDFEKRGKSKKKKSKTKVAKGYQREGFNADGTPRAPTIRLGAALARLEEIKKASSSKSAEEPPKQAPVVNEEAAKSENGSPKKAKNSKKKKNDDDYTWADLKKLEWSDARIKAFLARKSNPNAYYYRFNAPGEEQRTGHWTKEEHDRFMELIKDGVDYRWGILSMKTPGRVGYQCSNCKFVSIC